MKNQFKILVLLLLIHLATVAQESKSNELNLISNDSTGYLSIGNKELLLNSNFLYSQTTPSFSQVLNYNCFEVNKNEKIFLIGSDGAIFYNPKYFCKCRDCKKKKGLKKLKY